MVVYGLANTLFGVKDDRLLKLLSKITRLHDIVCRINSKCIEGSSHYLGDKQDFDVSNKGPSSRN